MAVTVDFKGMQLSTNKIQTRKEYKQVIITKEKNCGKET
jgi:hypothetical protein